VELVERWSQRPEPRAVVAAVHKHMASQLIGLESFVSLSYNRFDFERHRLEFVGCGHPRTIHYCASDGTVRLLEGSNLPIGVLEDETYEQAAVSFDDGDLFLLYSDGVTDIQLRDGTPVFEEQALLRYIHAHKYADNQSMLNSLLSYIKLRGRTSDFQDDVTIFILTRE
jgi:sigma-B regulation protein RsbU (phosphoserine phosphatase)